MSEYVQCKTQFKDQKALIQALMECGWKKEQIEVHQEAKNLTGYRGDTRKQKANIIIRRNHVGGASNDLGFKKNADGTYEAIISAYDRTLKTTMNDSQGYNERWLKGLTQKYTEKLYTRKAKENGYRVRRTKRKNGKIVLTLYR